VCNPISAGGPGTFMKTFVPSINNSLLVFAFDLYLPSRRENRQRNYLEKYPKVSLIEEF
jgi:hypothetical protein